MPFKTERRPDGRTVRCSSLSSNYPERGYFEHARRKAQGEPRETSADSVRPRRLAASSARPGPDGRLHLTRDQHTSRLVDSNRSEVKRGEAARERTQSGFESWRVETRGAAQDRFAYLASSRVDFASRRSFSLPRSFPFS